MSVKEEDAARRIADTYCNSTDIDKNHLGNVAIERLEAGDDPVVVIFEMKLAWNRIRPQRITK